MTDVRTLVYLARHGQTELNESGVLRGLLDPPLDETGRRQAANLGVALGPRQPALVVASPLLRARETAQPVADHAGLRVTPDGCLLDRDYGQWAGTPEETVVAQWGSVDAAPGVEPRSTVRDRAVAGLMALARRFPGASVVAVSHDAVNREVLAALDPELGDPDAIPQDNGCFNVLRWTDGAMTVLTVNEIPAGSLSDARAKIGRSRLALWRSAPTSNTGVSRITLLAAVSYLWRSHVRLSTALMRLIINARIDNASSSFNNLPKVFRSKVRSFR